MELKPVNKINSDANTIRVSDGNSPIRLIFKDAKGEVINLYDKIDYFYLTKDDETFYSVTDISYEGDEVIFRLPKLRKGQYKAEIRDKDGSIYPANEDLYILLRRSFEDDKDIYYFGHREDILNSVEPMVIQHIEKNPDKFRGERGQQGFPGRDGLPGIDGKDGKDGIDGEKGDPGKDGSMSFVDLTPEEKEQLRGERGRPGLDGKDGIDGIDGLPGKDGRDGIDGIDGKDGSIENINTNLIPMSADYWVNNSSYSDISGNVITSNRRARLKIKIPVVKGDIYTISDSTLPTHGFGGLRWYIYDDGVFIESSAIIRGQKRQITMTGNEITFTLYPQTGFETPYEMLLSNEFKQLIKFEKGDINTPVINAIYNLERDRYKELKDNYSIEKYKKPNNSYTDALNTALLENDYVYIPPGEYDMETNIKVPSNKTIEGAGCETVLNFSGTASQSFRMIGDIGFETTLKVNTPDFTNSMTVNDVSGFEVGDYVRIRSQRNALSMTESYQWFLGSSTGTTRSPLPYGEHKKIIAIDGDVITFDSHLIYPFYMVDASNEFDSALTATSIQKVNFIENVTIKNMTLNRPMYNYGISIRFARNVIIDNVYHNNVGYTGNILAGHTNIDRSLDCHVKNSVYYLNEGVTPPALNELTAFKIVSSQDSGFDNVEAYNAGQSVDFTYFNSAIPTTNCYIINSKIKNSQSTGITTHGGCYNTLMRDNQILGCKQGINNRGKRSIIKNNNLIGDVSLSDSELGFGIGMYQGGTGQSVISGNNISNYKFGIRFIDAGTLAEGDMRNLNVLITDNTISNGIYLFSIFRRNTRTEDLNINFVNNTLIMNTYNDTFQVTGIRFEKNTNGVTIFNNMIKGLRTQERKGNQRGIFIDHNCSNNTIAFNRFSELNYDIQGNITGTSFLLNKHYNVDNITPDI